MRIFMDKASEEDDRGGAYWALQGLKGIASVPAMVLVAAFVGFAGLARDAGLDWIEASFMVATVWALPSKIILIGAMTAGATLPAAAFAVALSAVRMMPMTVALVPELRGPRTRTATLLFLSHFVAVTAWVFALERVDKVPREYRTTFFAGFACALTVINTVLVAVVYNLMGQLPALATGALAFLTPVYFMCSLFGSARDKAQRLALFTGFAALPPAHWLAPDLDLLIAGGVGGLAAFAIGRWFVSNDAPGNLTPSEEESV